VDGEYKSTLNFTKPRCFFQQQLVNFSYLITELSLYIPKAIHFKKTCRYSEIVVFCKGVVIMIAEFTMILFVLIGLVIGFVAGRSTSRAGDAAKLHKELLKTRKEYDQYKRDVQEHFSSLSALTDQFNENCQRMSQHINEYGEKLSATVDIYQVSPDVPVDGDAVAESAPKTGVHQPLDYSNEPSGLLNQHKN
jgi:uncharacterized membrane-anchored protein YhcB (DUF1043 family)